MPRQSCLHWAAGSTCCASACLRWRWRHWGRRPAAGASAAPAARSPRGLFRHRPPTVTASDAQQPAAWPLHRLEPSPTGGCGSLQGCSLGEAPLACQKVALLRFRQGRETEAIPKGTGGAAKLRALLAPARQGPPWRCRPVRPVAAQATAEHSWRAAAAGVQRRWHCQVRQWQSVQGLLRHGTVELAALQQHWQCWLKRVAMACQPPCPAGRGQLPGQPGLRPAHCRSSCLQGRLGVVIWTTRTTEQQGLNPSACYFKPWPLVPGITMQSAW